MPNPKFPLKVVVLDDTQREDDGSTDFHVHGSLDAERWTWLQAELAKGQADNQLMIITAHIPIGVASIGSFCGILISGACQDHPAFILLGPGQACW